MGGIPPTANRMKEARVKRLCIVIILLEKIKGERNEWVSRDGGRG